MFLSFWALRTLIKRGHQMAMDQYLLIPFLGGWTSIYQLHPYAKVLAMFAFDSYSQSKRSPRPLSRHRPCKTPFPIGNASFNKPWPNYHGSIRFWPNPIGTPVSNGPFFVGTVDAHKQKREAGPFPSLYTAGWVLIKEKTRSKTRYGKSPASTHMDFGPQAANLPFLGPLVAKQWQFAESQHTAWQCRDDNPSVV